MSCFCFTITESNSRVREIQNTASSNPVSPRGAIGVTYPAVGGSSTSSGNLLVHIENGLHSSGSGSYELLSDAEMIQVNDEIHAAAEFRKLLAASEVRSSTHRLQVFPLFSSSQSPLKGERGAPLSWREWRECAKFLARHASEFYDLFAPLHLRFLASPHQLLTFSLSILYLMCRMWPW